MSETELARQLRELVRAQILVQDSPDQFGFRHSLMRDAVYHAMLGRERRHAHREVGQALEQMAQAAAGQDAEGERPSTGDLALHFYFAGAWDKALNYARQAGEQAQKMFAPREAAAFLTRALDAAEHLEGGAPPELRLERGQAYETTGQFEMAQADYEAALAAARGRGDMRAEWQSLLALGFLWAARDYAVSGEYLQGALSIARGLQDPAALARTMNRVGNWYLNADLPFDALEIHREALSIFEELNDKQGLADTYDLIGIANAIGSNLSASEWAFRRACELYRALDDRQGLSSALANLAEGTAPLWSDFIAPGTQTLTDGLALSREALDLAREIGWRAGEVYAATQVSLLYASRAEYGRALQLLQDALATAREIGHRQWLCVCSVQMGWYYAELLAPELANGHFAEALRLADEIQSPLLAVNICGLHARMQLEFAHLDAAEALLEKGLHKRKLFAASLEQPERFPAVDWAHLSVGERICAFESVDLLRRRGNAPAALEILNELAASGANVTPTLVIARLEWLRGLCLADLGRTEAAETALRVARAEMQVRENHSLLWRTEAGLARLRASHGDAAQANELRAHAFAIVERIQASIPDAALRKLYGEGARHAIWAETEGQSRA